MVDFESKEILVSPHLASKMTVAAAKSTGDTSQPLDCIAFLLERPGANPVGYMLDTPGRINDLIECLTVLRDYVWPQEKA